MWNTKNEQKKKAYIARHERERLVLCASLSDYVTIYGPTVAYFYPVGRFWVQGKQAISLLFVEGAETSNTLAMTGFCAFKTATRGTYSLNTFSFNINILCGVCIIVSPPCVLICKILGKTKKLILYQF